MENGHKNGSSAGWENTAALAKFNAFASAIKLRLPLPPKVILKNITKCDDLSSIVGTTPNVLIDKKSIDIIDWLGQEVRECCALLHMADGYVIDNRDQSINFKNDVYLFSSGDTLACAERRLKFALDAIEIFSDCSQFRPSAIADWKEALDLARYFDKSEQIDRLKRNLGFEIVDPASASTSISLKKFRDNDDLYVLQHGLSGYVEALDRILCKIGGREWDMQVLEVLEQKAAMIVEFNQIRYLVDVLPAVHSMVDMRIQQSLNRIFKTAFANLAFSIKKQVLNYYYQKYQTWNTAEMDPTYGTELNLIINNMAVGENKKNVGKYRSIAVRLTWHFMLSAKQCWWRIVNAVITTPALITPIIEILRLLAPVVSLRLPETKNRLILEGWSRLLDQNTLASEDQESSWTEFVLRLCNASPKKPIVEATEIINSFLLPMLSARPSLTLECLRKIFDDGTTTIAWNTEFAPTASADDAKVDSTRLFSAIFAIFARASRVGHSDTPGNLEVRQLCPRVLLTLTKRWALEDVTLSLDGHEWLKSSFDALPWTQQTFAFWLLRDCCAKNDVIEAPSCLCSVMELPMAKYSPIECPMSRDHFKMNCALTSMMEAACFSSEMAMMFLQDGRFANALRSSKHMELRHAIMYAARIVLDSQSLNEWKNVVKFLDEFFSRVEKENDSQNDIFVEQHEFRKGMRHVASVSLLSDVAILMMKEPKDANKEKEKEKENVRKLWLQNFYSIARDCQTLVSDKLQGYLAKETAMRYLWMACAGLVKSFPNSPPTLELLLYGLFEGYRRANLEFHRELLEDVAPHISADIAARLFAKLDETSVTAADETNAA